MSNCLYRSALCGSRLRREMKLYGPGAGFLSEEGQSFCFRRAFGTTVLQGAGQASAAADVVSWVKAVKAVPSS